jgi:hypothetical protein
MQGAGFMSGVGNRSGALLDQFKKSGGIGGKVSDITDVNKMTGLATMANSTLGTEGMGGFDALMMMEKVQNKQMSQKQFDEKLKEMQENKDPSLKRLSDINSTLEGQTTVLNNINTNLMENLGKTAVKAKNVATTADNALIKGTSNVAETVDATGIGDASMSAASSLKKNLVDGGLGEKAYDFLHPAPAQNAFPIDPMADAIQKGMARAMKEQAGKPIDRSKPININIRNLDGSVTNKTHK